MRVLAASQSDREAIESQMVQHGLLTYAIVHDGLDARQAPQLNVNIYVTRQMTSLGGCLRYAVERVPSLYAEVQKGQINDFGVGDSPRGMRGLRLADTPDAEGLNDSARAPRYSTLQTPPRTQGSSSAARLSDRSSSSRGNSERGCE